MTYLYGNNVVKAHLGRITDDTPEHTGVVIYSMTDMPLVSVKKIEGINNVLYIIDILNIYPYQYLYINYLGFWCDSTINSRHEETSTN